MALPLKVCFLSYLTAKMANFHKNQVVYLIFIIHKITWEFLFISLKQKGLLFSQDRYPLV